MVVVIDPKLLISVITPAFNSQDYIFKTYTSLLNQTHTNWEWLITDDHSSDSTFDILLDIAREDERVKPVQLSTNCGAAFARNNSMDRSKGEYFAFLDADDHWYELKLERQLDFMVCKNIDFSFTAYKCINENNKEWSKIVDNTHKYGRFTYEDMLRKKATLGCSTVMLKRSFVDDLRMPLIRTGQDYAFWLSLLKKTDAYILNECLTEYRILPGSLSRNKLKKAKRQWGIYRDIERLGFFHSSICFCFYAYRAVFRK